jgi:Flp pilus assembly protein TadD
VALPVYQQAAKELMEVHTLGLIEYRQGLCLLSPEHAKEALTHLERARELLPKNSDIHRHLGYVYDLLGRPQDSQASYEKSLALDGENPVTLNNLAFQIAEHGGDLDLALTYAQRARSRMPDKPEIADTIAWIYLKKNLVAESLGIFSDLVEKNQNNPEFRYHYAFALLKSGDRGRARLELQAALAAGAPLDLKNRILELLDSGD